MRYTKMWFDYVITALHYMAPPKCPVCGKRMKPTIVLGKDQSIQAIIDTITGEDPNFVCLNIKYPNPKFNPNKKLQTEKKHIPCPNNFKFKYSELLKTTVPKPAGDFYRKALVPIFGDSVKVQKTER